MLNLIGIGGKLGTTDEPCKSLVTVALEDHFRVKET